MDTWQPSWNGHNLKDTNKLVCDRKGGGGPQQRLCISIRVLSSDSADCDAKVVQYF